jgi:hypothetical protein
LRPTGQRAEDNLLQGRAVDTDGQLTVRNLADEAGTTRERSAGRGS